jgi:glycosyltransferase involved in cell wall biosynthesis
MGKTKLSVIVCTYERGESLVRCLESLTKQGYQDFEVVIVEGGSKDSTNEVIEKYGRKLKIKKVVYKGKELSRVRDRGWREARGEIVSWIDDDVVVSKDWVQAIVKIMDENPRVGGVSGPTLVKKKLLIGRDVFSFYEKGGILAWIWDKWFLEGGKYEVGRLFKSGAWSPGSNFSGCLRVRGLSEVDYLEACNMSLRRRLVKKVGGFDYGYTKVAEWCELDLAKRVAELGYKLVFSAKVKVHHNISRGGVYPRRTKAKERMENFFKFYFRHIYRPRVDYAIKLGTYLVFLNGYWFYKAVVTKNLDWLGGWVGTISGFLKYGFKEK